MNIRCTNCGADVSVVNRTVTVVCPYCKTGLFVQVTVGVPRMALVARLEREGVVSALVDFLKQQEVSGASISILSIGFDHHPYWQITRKTSGKDVMIAAGHHVVEPWREMVTPAAELQTADQMDDGGDEFPPPELLLADVAGADLETEKDAVDKQVHAALIYLPVYTVSFKLAGDETIVAYLNGVTGEVVVENLPRTARRAQTRLLALALIAGVVFFGAAAYLFDGWMLAAVYIMVGAGVGAGLRRLLAIEMGSP